MTDKWRKGERFEHPDGRKFKVVDVDVDSFYSHPEPEKYNSDPYQEEVPAIRNNMGLVISELKPRDRMISHVWLCYYDPANTPFTPSKQKESMTIEPSTHCWINADCVKRVA